MPGSIISGRRMVALRLSAVTVVTMSLPRTASMHRRAAHDLQARQVQARQVAFELGAGAGVGVEQAQLADALQVVESQRLEFALRAIADQRHGAAVLPGQVACSQHRHGGGAQCGGQCELGHQQRVAGVHIGQHTKGRDGEQALGRVLGVAIDVL